MKIHSRKIIVLFLGIFLALPALTHAQVLTPYTIEDAQTASNITITPKHPSVGESVVVKVLSFAIDLDNSFISFYRNNTLIQSGFGLREVAYGAIEKQTLIRVVIETPNDQVVEHERNLIPGSLNIVWESNSYTPPFYRGKSLYTKESPLTLTAIPTMRDTTGKLISPNDIKYTWKINGEIQSKKSGLGKKTVLIEKIFIGSQLQVEVLAESRNGEVFAKQSETVVHNIPQLYFYENDPLYGVNWSQVLDQEIVQGEISLTAVPYFFTTQNPDNLLFTWRANGRELPEQSSRITFRNTTDLQGLVRVQLSVENIRSFFEQAHKTLSLRFN